MSKRTVLGAAAAAVIAAALGLAVPFEGLKLTPYRDSGGVWTVCFGHTGKDVVPGQAWDFAGCKKVLGEDMGEAVETVERCAPGLPPKTHAALADAVFNIGPRIVCSKESSTLARKLAAGDLVGACNELPRWDKVVVGGKTVALAGLTKRRHAEKLLCLEGLKED